MQARVPFWLVLSFAVGCGQVELSGLEGGSQHAQPLQRHPAFCDVGVNNLCLVNGWNLHCSNSGPMTWVAGWEKYQQVCVRGENPREPFCDLPASVANQNACNAFAGQCSGEQAWVLGWDWFQISCAAAPGCVGSTPKGAGLNGLLFAYDADGSAPSCTPGSLPVPLSPLPASTAGAALPPAPAYGHPSVLNEGAPRGAALRYELSRSDFKDMSLTGPTDPQGIAHEITLTPDHPLDDLANRRAMTVLARVRVTYNRAATWAQGKDEVFSTNVLRREGLWGLSLSDRELFFSFETDGGPMWMRSWKFQSQRTGYKVPLDKWVLIGGRVIGGQTSDGTATLFVVEDGVLRKFEDLQSGASGSPIVYVGHFLRAGRPEQRFLTLGPGWFNLADTAERNQFEVLRLAGLIVDLDDVRYYARGLTDQDLLEVAAGQQ